MQDVFTQLAALRVIPMVVMDNAAHAGKLADALVHGGLPVVEITLRTPQAIEAVRALADRGDLLVGAGTILSTDQADAAIDAGANFLVAPGTNPKVVEHVLKRGNTMIPGVATATEIETAMSLGLKTLKFFPAEIIGGIAALKAYAGPFPDVRFLPTGGITPELLPDYLRVPSVVACGGSWLAPREMLAAGHFDAIACLIEDAKKLIAPPPEIAT